MVVLDTSALIYWTLDPARLSKKAEKSITVADAIVISSISIWEIGIKVKRKRLAIPLPLETYVEKLKKVDRVEVMAVSEEVWMKNLELAWGHRDPADRTIVATAMLMDSPLVTSDRVIRRFYSRSIW
jgi:PIN domain nuclease of toxin-antitoxin system